MADGDTGTGQQTAPLGGFNPLSKGQGASRGAGLDSTDRSHLTGKCSYPEYVKEKFYEYAAMAETIAVLAGLYGKQRQKDAFEALKLGVKEDAENGSIAFLMNFLAASGNYSSIGDQERAAGWAEIFGDKKTAQMYEKSAQDTRAAADEEMGKAVDYLGAQFKAIYDEIRRRYNECGFLYAFATVATDGAINIAIAAISDGLAKGALEALKKIKFFVRRLPLGRLEVEMRHGVHVKTEGFTQDQLATKYGKPEDNHVGGVLPDENRPIEPGKPKKKLTGKALGDAAEAQARKDLAAEGYTDIQNVENKSGNGLDVVGRDPNTGDVKVLEVKANSAGLNDLQANGGQDYTSRQLDLAQNSTQPTWEGQQAAGSQINDWMQNAPDVKYEIWKYDVDPETGAVSKKRVADWDWEKGKKPKRLQYRDGAGAAPPQQGTPLPPSTGPPAAHPPN